MKKKKEEIKIPFRDGNLIPLTPENYDIGRIVVLHPNLYNIFKNAKKREPSKGDKEISLRSVKPHNIGEILLPTKFNPNKAKYRFSLIFLREDCYRGSTKRIKSSRYLYLTHFRVEDPGDIRYWIYVPDKEKILTKKELASILDDLTVNF